MAQAYVDPALIPGLNQLAALPLPILRLIVLVGTLQVDNWSRMQHRQPTQLSHTTLQRILKNEGVNVDCTAGLGSLEIVFKTSLKRKLEPKQLRQLLNENTLLQSEAIDHIIDVFQDSSSAISNEPPIHWSVLNLRMDEDGQMQNKLYVKLKMGVDPAMTLTLGEFRTVMSELKGVEEAMPR